MTRRARYRRAAEWACRSKLHTPFEAAQFSAVIRASEGKGVVADSAWSVLPPTFVADPMHAGFLGIVHCCTRNWLPCHYALPASVALWTRWRPSVATPKCGGAPPTKPLMHRLMTCLWGLYRLAQLPEWSLSGSTAGKRKALGRQAARRQEDIGPLRGARYTRGAGRALAHKRMSMTRQSPIQLPIG